MTQHYPSAIKGNDRATYRGETGGSDLEAHVRRALRLYPCDLLLVHMDSDGRTEERRENILEATRQIEVSAPVVPVRTTEAWLMVDEFAIRKAAGNPNGSMALALDRIQDLESRSDPKEHLHQLLKAASGLRAGRLHQFDLGRSKRSIPDYIADFSILNRLPSFERFREDLKGAIDRINRNPSRPSGHRIRS